MVNLSTSMTCMSYWLFCRMLLYLKVEQGSTYLQMMMSSGVFLHKSPFYLLLLTLFSPMVSEGWVSIYDIRDYCPAILMDCDFWFSPLEITWCEFDGIRKGKSSRHLVENGYNCTSCMTCGKSLDACLVEPVCE